MQNCCTPPDADVYRYRREKKKMARNQKSPSPSRKPVGHHSNPFVLGSISRIRSSREQAPRRALANALKIASIL
jgi:hypothetical protein